jgi:hypothetical protein
MPGEVSALDKNLSESERADERTYSIPWFRHFEPKHIEQYAKAFKKASVFHRELLADDPCDSPVMGKWNFFNSRT